MSMTFIPPPAAAGEPLLPADSAGGLWLRDPGQGGEYRGAAQTIEAACLRCPDTPCSTYSLDERGGIAAVAADVCPVDALHAGPSGMGVVEGCVGCGICVLRCGFGAIHLRDGRAEVVLTDDGYVETDPVSASDGRASILIARNVGGDTGSRIVAAIQCNVAGERQSIFYRFVCSLLTALGLPARLSNAGDTSFRMDAVCPHPDFSVPVEIKSPTEVDTADPKSVRQALENHVIMRGRTTDPTSAATATFAIGHEPLPARSDARELASDIEATYGVRVRIFSTAWLLHRLVEIATGAASFDVDAMREGRMRE
jgi:ferredoxin